MFVDGFFAGCITSLILSFTLAVMADCEVKDRRLERAQSREMQPNTIRSHTRLSGLTRQSSTFAQGIDGW
jgi:hypothetical protein